MGRSRGKARNFPIDPRQVYWKYGDQFHKMLQAYQMMSPYMRGSKRPGGPFSPGTKKARPYYPGPYLPPGVYLPPVNPPAVGASPRLKFRSGALETKEKRKRKSSNYLAKAGKQWLKSKNGFRSVRGIQYGKKRKIYRYPQKKVHFSF